MGSPPDSKTVGGGVPEAVTINAPEVPTVNVALLELVIIGGVEACPTIKVKLCVALVPKPFCAVNVIG